MNVRWKLSALASCLQAARTVAHGGALVDPRLTEVLQGPVADLQASLVEERVPAAAYWSHLTALAAEFDSTGQLSDVALNKTIGVTEAKIRQGRFQRNIGAIRKAFMNVHPQLSSNLEPVWQSLKQQWDFQGQGLLAGMKQWTDADLLVDDAMAIGMVPVSGGGGFAHLASNRAYIEVAEPAPELPEILRLGWLLGQLNLDLPRFTEKVSPAHRDLVPSLAMLPVVLAAGEPLKLSGGADPATMKRALEIWMPAVVGSGDTLQTWWEVFRGMRPEWPDALLALDRLLGE